MNVVFARPVFLALGLAAFLLVVLGMALQTRRRRKLGRYLGGPRRPAVAAGPHLHRLRFGRSLFLALASLLAAVGAAGPEWVIPTTPTAAPEPPKSIVLAVDVSASMQATDVLPTRLGRAAQVAQELLAGASGSRVGLLVFAGDPYVLTPPTYDHRVVDFFLDGLSATVATAQDPGSLLTSAIHSAGDLLETRGSVEGERIVILISDGETQESEAELTAALEEAFGAGGRVHTVGLGTTVGGEVSIPRSSFQVGGPVLNDGGDPAVSRLDEGRLERLARTGRGRYAHANDESALAALAASLETRSPEAPIAPADSGGPDIGFSLAVAALLLLLLEGLLEARERLSSRTIILAEA